MARVNCFVEVSTDKRNVSVGGRAGNDRAAVLINTDNGGGHDCSLRADAYVTGRGLRASDRRKKSVGDDRKSRFSVVLPDQNNPDFCQVVIHLDRSVYSAAPNMVGAVPKLDGGYWALPDMARVAVYADLVQTDIPHVSLPGGGTLAEAIALIAMLRQWEAMPRQPVEVPEGVTPKRRKKR